MNANTSAGAGLNLIIDGALGLAIVCTTYVMWRSWHFSLLLVLLGPVSGIAILGAQLTVAPTLQALFDILYFCPLVFWVWILWAGVVCVRARPHDHMREDPGSAQAAL